jgi:pimeloyl-ACP methyl ester carboxylesterase
VLALTDRLALTSLQLQGYRSRRVETSVGGMHVLDAAGAGRLPPVVLLHGFTSAAVHYTPMLRSLRPRVRRLILPDLPAHGFSDTPEGGLRSGTLRCGLIEALDAVIDEPAVVFGNSMGGVAAVHYALARPQKVRGLYLCSPTGAPMTREALARFVESFRMDSHEAALDFVDRLLVRPSLLRQVLAWGVRKKFSHPAMRGLLESITPEDLLRPSDLRSLAMPVLLMWGRGERILPTENLDFFRRNLPRHARIVEPEEVGHSPYLETPELVANSIISFAAELEHHQLMPYREAA